VGLEDLLGRATDYLEVIAVIQAVSFPWFSDCFSLCSEFLTDSLFFFESLLQILVLFTLEAACRRLLLGQMHPFDSLKHLLPL
jgi:hypothetical protein